MNQDQFLGECITHLVENGITVRLDNTTKIRESGVSFSGLFDQSRKLMRIGTDRAHIDWFPIFVHEYAHFLQTLDGFSEKYPDECWEVWYDWLTTKKKIDKQKLKKCVTGIQKTEYDAEKRVIRLVKKHGLDIDLNKYVKESNVYILSYTVLMKHRKQDKKSFASNVPELVKMMPNKLLTSWTKLPENFEEILVEKCF